MSSIIERKSWFEERDQLQKDLRAAQQTVAKWRAEVDYLGGKFTVAKENIDILQREVIQAHRNEREMSRLIWNAARRATDLGLEDGEFVDLIKYVSAKEDEVEGKMSTQTKADIQREKEKAKADARRTGLTPAEEIEPQLDELRFALAMYSKKQLEETENDQNRMD